MKNLLKSSLCLLVILLFGSVANAQKVAGFFPDWVNPTSVNNVQYDKLTDIYYAFLHPSTTGQLSPTTAGRLQTILKPLVEKGHAKGVKVHVSIGGANNSSTFSGVVANVNYRANFVNTLADIFTTYDIDGVDIDWEFPTGNDANNLASLMQEIRNKLNELEVTMGKRLYLSMAVGPLLWNTDGINATSIALADYIHVMAFDAGGNCCVCDNTNHSSYAIAERALQKWTTGLSVNCGGNASGKNVPHEKLVLSIPFYSSKTGYAGYNSFSTSNPSGYFNDPTGTMGGRDYNSCPMIQEKAKLIMETYGGAGLWTWELTQDRNDQYSLLSCMYDAMEPYRCNVPKPDLGEDRSICGQTSLTLSTGITSTSGLTFKWYRNNQLINGATSNTYNATQAGTYKVEVSNGSCDYSDEVSVLSALPNIDLGSGYELCNPATVVLDAGAQGPFTYQWKRNGQTINGATAKTYTATQAGNYEVTVGATSCQSKTASTSVTSALVNAEGDAMCEPGQATLRVLDNGENYSWYNQLSGGSSLATGKHFYPNVTQTTTYYVERQNTAQSHVLGKTTAGSGWQGDVSHYAQKITLDAPATISSVSFQTAAAGNVTIQILASNGTTVVASQTVSASSGFQAANVSFALNAGTYFIRASAAPAGTLYLNSSAMTNDQVITGVATLFKAAYTSWSSPAYSGVSTYYGFFFNITLSSGSGQACVRTPVVALISNCTSISTSENELIKVFPNPFSSEINLSLPENMVGSTYELINPVGQLVGKGTVLQTQQQLNTQHLPSGVYIMHFHHETGSSLLKIVKTDN